jgi:aminoglycoside 3-N-acetyltransferase
VAQYNGKILSFGTDLTHSLTSIHVSEDAYENEWPVNDWYLEKSFKIVDKDYDQERVIRERRPHWGALHFAERTLCKDLIKQGILQTSNEFGVLIEVIDARKLNEFLRGKQKEIPGYPYFWLK